MQKKSMKKLALSKETLRAMNPEQMSQVAGGEYTARCDSITSNPDFTVGSCFRCW